MEKKAQREVKTNLLGRVNVVSGVMKKVFCLGEFYLKSLHNRAGFMHSFTNTMECLQIFHILFCSTGYYVPKSNWLMSSIQFICNIISLYPFLKDTSDSVNEAVAFGIAGLIILNLCITLLSFLDSRLQGLLRSISFYLTDYSARMFFLPILGVLLLSLRCEQNENGDWVRYLNSSAYCSDISQIPIMLISSFAAIILIVQIAIFKIAIIESIISPKNPYAQKTGLFNFVLHLARSGIMIFFVAIPKCDYSAIYSVSFLILSVVIIYFSYVHSFLYNHNAIILRNSLQWCNFGLGVYYFLIFHYQDEIDYAELIGLIIILSGVILTAIFSQRQLVQELLLSRMESKDEGILLHHFIKLVQIIDCGKLETKESETFTGIFLNYHYLHCEDTKCCLSHTSGQTNLIEDSNILIRSHLIQGVAHHIRKVSYSMPNFVCLRLFYIVFVTKYMKNFVGSWAMINELLEMNINIVQKFQVFMFRKKLNQKVDSTKNSGMQTVIVMKGLREKMREAKFKTLIETTIQAYSSFWTVWQQRNPKLSAVEKVGFQILENNEKIDKVWASFKKRKLISLRCLKMYATYSEQIQEDPLKGQEIKEYMHEAKDTAYQDTLLSYVSNGGGVITISADNENMGIVRQYNAGFCQLSGYNSQDIMHLSMDYIMPSIYHKPHKNALIEYTRHIEFKNISTLYEKKGFLLTKSKYIIPIFTKVMEAPNYTNSYMYVSTVFLNKEICSHDYLHILTNSEMIITNVSSNCVLYLGITAEIISMHSVNLNSIIPNIYQQKINSLFPVTLYSNLGTHFEENATLSGDAFSKNYEGILAPIKFNKEVVGYSLQLQIVDRDSTPILLDRARPCAEFAYNFERNGFYLFERSKSINKKKNEELGQYSLTNSFAMNVFGSQDSSKTNNKEEDIMIKKGNGFYQQILERVERISRIMGTFHLYNKCLKQPDYSSNITCYRLDSAGNLATVSSSFIPLLLAQEDLGSNGEISSERRHVAHSYTSSAKILKNALKSKGHLYKIISTMPIPSSFNGLIYISLFILMISFGITIGEKFIVDQALKKIMTNIEAIYLQFDIITVAITISTCALQGQAVNAGTLALASSYPGNQNSTEFGNWLVANIKSNAEDFQEKIASKESIEQADIISGTSGIKVNFVYNGSDVEYSNAEFHVASKLLIEYGFKMGSFFSLSDFSTYKDIISIYEHNLKNVLFTETLNSLNVFVALMTDSFETQITLANSIGYAFIGAVVLLALLQTIFVVIVTRIIFRQAKLFLHIPVGESCKQQKNANNLLNELKSNDYEMEEQSEDSEVSGGDSGRGLILESDIKLRMGEVNEEENRDIESRKLEVSFLRRFDWSWRLILSVLLTLGMMMIYLIKGTLHFNEVREISSIFNSTSRVLQVLTTAENFERSFFMNRDQMIIDTTAEEAISKYDFRSHELITLMYIHSGKLLNIFSGSEYDKMKTFIYYNICDFNSGACTNTSNPGGFLQLLTEFHNLLKLGFQTYYTQTASDFLNSNYFISAVHLLFDKIKSSYYLFFSAALTGVKTLNNDVSSLLLLCLIFYIIISCIVTLFIWIPYIQSKKEAMQKMRLMLSLVPLKAISHVKAFQDVLSEILFNQRNQLIFIGGTVLKWAQDKLLSDSLIAK